MKPWFISLLAFSLIGLGTPVKAYADEDDSSSTSEPSEPSSGGDEYRGGKMGSGNDIVMDNTATGQPSYFSKSSESAADRTPATDEYAARDREALQLEPLH